MSPGEPRKAWPGLACGFTDFSPFQKQTGRAEARTTLGGLGQPFCPPPRWSFGQVGCSVTERGHGRGVG